MEGKPNNSGEDVKTVFKKFRRREIQAMMCNLSETGNEVYYNQIQVLETGDRDSKFEEWIDKLPEDDCRVLLFDYCYTIEKRNCTKFILVIWCPLGAPNKKKITYAYSRNFLSSTFKGMQKIIEADSKDKVKKYI